MCCFSCRLRSIYRPFFVFETISSPWRCLCLTHEDYVLSPGPSVYLDYFQVSPKTEILGTDLDEYLPEDDYMHPEKDRSLSRPRDSVTFSALTCPEVLPGQKFELDVWACTVL
jgi:hypothetical protein